MTDDFLAGTWLATWWGRAVWGLLRAIVLPFGLTVGGGRYVENDTTHAPHGQAWLSVFRPGRDWCVCIGQPGRRFIERVL